MEASEAIKKFNSFEQLQNINFQNEKKFIKPNSKIQFLKYGTQNIINTLWSKLPKFYDNEQNEINDYNNVDLLLTLQKLETILYKNGLAVLKNNFLVGEVVDYIAFLNNINYLKVKFTFSSNSFNIEVIEEWLKDKNGYNFKYNIVNKSNKKLEEFEAIQILEDMFDYKALKTAELPFTLFFNNSLKNGDLDLVNSELFEILNNDLEVLSQDGFISAPWIFSSGDKNFKNQIKEGLYNLKERFISLNPQLTLYDQQPLHLLQGQSQALTLIQKIDKSIALIKKFAFMKADTSDLGTKNVHSTEAQQINSDFEDFVEQKANLRELQLLEFFNKFYNKNIKKIMVTGSTFWLEEQAKKVQINQNGNALNANLEIENEDGENGNNEN